MGERRGLNPRVVDSQSTALIHLATSAPTPAQLQVYCCVLELGEAKLQQVEASWQSFKQRGWAVHFIDFTSFYLRLKIGAGRAVKARLVDSKRAASYGFDEQQAPTPIKMKSSKLRLKKRAPIRESHCALAPCIGFQTCAPLNYKL
ncbi:hypothetical protein SLA2020_430500 [Shorea laevis]